MEEEEKVIYKIYVITSNIPDAGTNSNVFLQLYGKLKSTRNQNKSSELNCLKFPLEKSKTSKKKFQPGSTDVFEVEDIYIGSLKKLRVSIDNSASTWHLKKIIIVIDQYRKKYEFFCNKWLNGGKTFHELMAIRLDKAHIEEKDLNDYSDQDEQDEKPTKKSILEKIPYDIKIKTSEFSKLNDPPKIDLKIIGKFGETNKIKLNNFPSDNEKEKFLSNNLDIFKLDSQDVGNILKIKFYVPHDSQAKITDWFFDSIVINLPSKSIRYFFDTKSRMNVKKEQDRNLIEVFPIRVDRINDSKICNIYLYTTKLANKSDIINNTKLSIFAEFGHILDLKPVLFNGESQSFNQDILHFHFTKKDMAEIYKLKLVHLYPGRKTNWLLKRVELIYDKKIVPFPANKWLTTDKDNKKCEIKLYAENKNFCRTISTLSHRRIEESLNDENPDHSYESDFSDENDNKKKNKNSKSRSLSRESLRSYDRHSDEIESKKHQLKKLDHKKDKLHLDLSFEDDIVEPRRKNNNFDEKYQIKKQIMEDDEISRRVNELLSREKPQSNRHNFDGQRFNENNNRNFNFKTEQFRDVGTSNKSSYNQPRMIKLN